MTVLRSPGDEPGKDVAVPMFLNALGGDVVPLDGLLSAGGCAPACRSSRRDGGFLRDVERITRKGWDHTLRTSFLLAVMTILVAAVLWVVAGLLTSVCTTIVLLLANYIARLVRSVRIAW